MSVVVGVGVGDFLEVVVVFSVEGEVCCECVVDG